MDKNNIIGAVRQELESRQCPSDSLEGQTGLQWFLPLTDDYENDYAVGELFFASDVTDEDMNGIDLAQINLVFKREIASEHVDALRAFFARINRVISGGRFDAQQEEETCFAEYGHDLVLPSDLTDEQCVKAIMGALDLAEAYMNLVYDGVRGICAGDLTVEGALNMIYEVE